MPSTILILINTGDGQYPAPLQRLLMKISSNPVIVYHPVNSFPTSRLLVLCSISCLVQGVGLPLDFLPLISEICPRFSSVTSMIDATELPSTATLLVDSWCALPKEAIRGMSRLWPNLILRPVPRPRPRLKPKPGFKPRPKPKPRPRPRPKHRIRKRMRPVTVNFWERALILRLWENRLEPLWMRGLMIVDHRWAESGWSSCSAAIHNEVSQIQKHERGQTWRNYRHGNRVLFITARSQLSSYFECSTSQSSSVLLPSWSLTKTKSADPLSFLDFYLASAFSNR